jgi:demethylspheroidene O-methyltransferase
MADLGLREVAGPLAHGGWINRLAASRAFQRFCARVPLLRRVVRAEGAALFDLMQGFVRSQVLSVLVETRLLHRLAEAPALPGPLAVRTGLPEDRLRVLLQAGAAMGLLRRHRDGAYGLARRGAAFVAVPGLEDLVRHHSVLYADLTDPMAFFRGSTDPDLARFWPYVLGGQGGADQAARYSDLMAETQALVAEDTLDALPLTGIRHLMDVGGGTGAFLRAVHARHPRMDLTLFDLPHVVAGARLPPGAKVVPGSFRDGVLPQGADAISLIRVLYDHADSTVLALLSAIYEVLPARGTLIVSEPMSGGARPDPQTDVYFAVYTLAMRTGRTRSADEIAKLARAVGFEGVKPLSSLRPYVTCALTAQVGSKLSIRNSTESVYSS